MVIAGPCVIETEELTLRIAAPAEGNCRRDWQMPLVFKASFDKANRTSVDAYRGPGLERGLAILRRVKRRRGCR